MTEEKKFYQNIKKVDESVKRFNNALDELIERIGVNERDDRDEWFSDDEGNFNRC